MEKLYNDERPNDTGIYGSFAQKPNLIGIPWVLRVWKRDLTELPALISEINNFYAGTHPKAARFLLDHNVRYVVWSVRESKDIEKWQSIMESIDSDYRWMELSDDAGFPYRPLDSPMTGFARLALACSFGHRREGTVAKKLTAYRIHAVGQKHRSWSTATVVDGRDTSSVRVSVSAAYHRQWHGMGNLASR